MKLFDWLILGLFVSLLFSQAFLTLSSNKTESSGSNPVSSISQIASKYPQLSVKEIYFDYINSTKLVLTQSTSNQPFIVYFNPNRDYSFQFDLIQKTLNRSKIMKQSLLVLDLAANQPYATLQSN